MLLCNQALTDPSHAAIGDPKAIALVEGQATSSPLHNNSHLVRLHLLHGYFCTYIGMTSEKEAQCQVLSFDLCM